MKQTAKLLGKTALALGMVFGSAANAQDTEYDPRTYKIPSLLDYSKKDKYVVLRDKVFADPRFSQLSEAQKELMSDKIARKSRIAPFTHTMSKMRYEAGQAKRSEELACLNNIRKTPLIAMKLQDIVNEKADSPLLSQEEKSRISVADVIRDESTKICATQVALNLP